MNKGNKDAELEEKEKRRIKQSKLFESKMKDKLDQQKVYEKKWENVKD